MATISAWSADGRREVVVPGPLRRGQIVNIPINNRTVSSGPPVPIIPRIQRLACEVWGIKIHQLLSDRRSVQFTEPRFAAILMASEKTSFTLHRLGRAFDRDHTTIMHAIRRAKQMLEDGREPFTSQYEEFSKVCESAGLSDLNGQAEGQCSGSQTRALAQEFDSADVQPLAPLGRAEKTPGQERRHGPAGHQFEDVK